MEEELKRLEAFFDPPSNIPVAVKKEMDRRRAYFRRQRVEGLYEKYLQTGDRKYLHAIASQGIDVDYSIK